MKYFNLNTRLKLEDRSNIGTDDDNSLSPRKKCFPLGASPEEEEENEPQSDQNWRNMSVAAYTDGCCLMHIIEPYKGWSFNLVEMMLFVAEEI